MMLQDQKTNKAKKRKEKGMPLILFYDKEIINGILNSPIPLLIRVIVVNYNVQRVLIDQGSFCAIMHPSSLGKLHMSHKKVIPYKGNDFQ